jgi:SAM-dependent methyltransferase
MGFLNLQIKKIQLLYLINFLAAFLLFQIELIISKIFLPKFGGSYLIWGACIVFFQSILLLGYLYSHIVVQKTWLFKYKYLHLALIILPLLFFPGRPLPIITADNHLPIVISIFPQLFISIGIVFFALSTVSIVTQSWLFSSDLSGYSNPFILYGASNLGSFIALLSYPFIFELAFDTNQQLVIWRFGYLLFVLFYSVAFRLIKVNHTQCLSSAPILKTTTLFKQFKYTEAMREGISWFLLSAAGSVIFLSVTNIITYEITPCPLLWIIPLCVYLLSFVLNFKEKPFFPEWIKNNINLYVGFTTLLFFFTQMRIFPILIIIIAYGVSLFILCMYCQRELFMTKPKGNSRLTVFYLIIAFGGAAGSVMVTWIAPLIFTNTLEFIFGLFVISLALSIKENKSRIRFLHLRFIVYIVLLLILWPLVFKQYNFFGIIIMVILFKWIFSELKTARVLNLCLVCIFITAAFFSDNWMHNGRNIYVHRNYYGIYRLNLVNSMLVLLNGTTVHGQQYIDKNKKNEPLSYFHHDTPVGKLLDSNIFQVKNMGIVGLGGGTLAAYGREGQEIDFFELDRDVFDIAESFFTYLKDSHAKINCIFGDARISLKKAPENNYDLLIIDAFSSDSVPVHLLTVEAIKEYKKHLKPDGIILFHVSSRYFDLTPVLFNNAKVVNAYAVVDSNGEGNGQAYWPSLWVTLTWDAHSKDSLIQKLHWKEEGDKFKVKKMKPWTDAYSNVLSVLKIENFIIPVKRFMPLSW